MKKTLSVRSPVPARSGHGEGRESISRELIKAMAMDAGKNLCAYLEVMFPEVWHEQNSGFKISMKHHVYNDIMALADLHDEDAIRKRLAHNEAHRKQWVGAYRKMRLTIGDLCPKCGFGTRVVNKKWRRCKKCGTEVARRDSPTAAP